MFPSIGFSVVVATIGFVAATCVHAQDKSQYTLFNPTPDSQMRSFNTDRPTKSNVPYTVDAGHFQYEGDIFIYGFDNTSTPDTTTKTWIIGNPTFKAGLLNNLDVEVNFSAYNSIESQTRSTGALSRAAGFGDTYTRFKFNVFGNDGGKAALAFIPYAKWPTAPPGVGNGFVEGGLIAPLAISLPAGFTTILMGEVDYLKNPTDSGYHANFPALVNLSHSLSDSVTAYGEIYANWSSRGDVRDLYTLDFALAWSPRPNFQLDVGVNIGLVSAATPYQLYMGVAQRF